MKVCTVDEDLSKKLKKFRFRKATNNAAIVSELADCVFQLVLSQLSSFCITITVLTLINNKILLHVFRYELPTFISCHKCMHTYTKMYTQ